MLKLDNPHKMITVPGLHERVPRNAQFDTTSDRFGIRKIPNSYFKDCDQLKYVKMTDDICKFGDYVFNNYKNLNLIEP